MNAFIQCFMLPYEFFEFLSYPQHLFCIYYIYEYQQQDMVHLTCLKTVYTFMPA